MILKTIKHGITIMGIVILAFLSIASGASSPATQNQEREQEARQAKNQPQQTNETQVEKFERLFTADAEKIVAAIKGMETIESLEATLKPQAITGIGEITDAKLSEPGRPYYFKIRALYKGYDANAEILFLQDLGQRQSNVMDAALGAVFGVDTNVYQVDYLKITAPLLPTNANAVATFYIMAARLADGKQNESLVCFLHNIEPPSFNPSNFIVASGMRYITVDTRVQTQQDVMLNMMTGGAMGNSSQNVFDPVVYPLVDLMDARVAMDKKNIRNDYTFPTVRVKYASEVIFKGQSNTTITVSTADNVLTERMNFTGRASAVKNGEKTRVYYTIAKDPSEKWEIQAIERL